MISGLAYEKTGRMLELRFSTPFMPIIAALLLFATATPGSAADRLIDRLEASVNAAPILTSDISRLRRSLGLRRQLDPLFASSRLALKDSGATDSEILEILIHDRLILSAFPASDAEVDQEISSIQAGQQISRERLRGELARNGFEFEDYFELLRLSIAKRNLIDRDIRSKVSVSDDDIKNFYYSRFSGNDGPPLSYRVRVLSLSRSSYKSERALREAAESAMTAIKSGDPFEEVLMRYAESDGSAAPGDLGYLTEDQMAPLIRAEVRKLKVGGISPVIGSTKQALMILKLVDISTGEDAKFARMKEEIRNQLHAGEYQRQIQLWLARQEQAAFVHRAGDR